MPTLVVVQRHLAGGVRKAPAASTSAIEAAVQARVRNDLNGTKRTCQPIRRMSAIGGKPDMMRISWNVR